MRRQRFPCLAFIRLALPAFVVAAFLLFVFTASIIDETTHWHHSGVDFPDFSHYKFIQTIPDDRFPIHPNNGARVVIIGDIHAMNQSLTALLDQIGYDLRSDTLIHLGDIVSKNQKLSSEPLLTFLSTNRILGVRGNNDQKVIEWRAWMVWIASLPGGQEWLEDLDSLWSHVDGEVSNAEFDAWLKKSHKKWKPYVPSGWKLQGKHYKNARDMSQDHYDYLRSLPLVLYAPTAHTYFVHAGLLPADPTRPYNDPKQPLSHLPATAKPKEDATVLRGLQEMALLNDIPQNRDPWVLMNMRSISEDGIIRDGKKGIPWSDLWNDAMRKCTGLTATNSKTRCFPSTVLYGHAAARGLDVKRWSVGVDTGCAYGRRLTATILDADSTLPQVYSRAFDASLRDSFIPFGDKGVARIVSVKCHV